MAKHNDKPLVNTKVDAHSTLTLIDVKLKDGTTDLTGWTVKGDVTDSSPTPGLWAAVRSKTGDQKKQLRLILRCKKQPKRGKVKEDRPDGGDLTITLTSGANTQPVDPPPPVDYVDEPAP